MEVRPSPSKSSVGSVGSSGFGHGRVPGYGTLAPLSCRAELYSQPSVMPSLSVSALHGAPRYFDSRPLARPSVSQSAFGAAAAFSWQVGSLADEPPEAPGPGVAGAGVPALNGEAIGARAFLVH